MTTPAVPRSPLDRFFGSLHRSQVTRSPQGMIGGVCAGLAERLDLSPTVVRAVAVVLALLGPAAGLYLLAWLLLPDRQGNLHLERALRRGDTTSVVLLVVAVLAVVGDTSLHARVGWLSLAIVVLAVWAVTRASSRPSPPQGPE
ncbi:MAG: PspC domain-containing protein [Actinomycetota bacterium]|nr:PspC domain-containing protein [Actinomycetota bacterium]